MYFILMNFHPEQPEEEVEAIGAVCVCVSAVFCLCVTSNKYMYIFIHICVCVVNTCSGCTWEDEAVATSPLLGYKI